MDVSGSHASHTLMMWSSTFDGHLNFLQEVFTWIHKAGLKLKDKKCLFLWDKVSYLGHVVTKNGIKQDPSKTDEEILSARGRQTSLPVPRINLMLSTFCFKFLQYYFSSPSSAKAGSHVLVDYGVSDYIRYSLLVSTPCISSGYKFIWMLAPRDSVLS